MQNPPNSPTFQVVESHMTMERIALPDDGPQWIAVTLTFDPVDPWAVTLSLYAGPAPVRWTFARDLLVEGLHEPTGEGDVLILPGVDDDGRAVVEVELRSPDGVLLGQLPTREVSSFVGAALDVVPVGAEAAYLDLDALVGLLLHPDH